MVSGFTKFTAGRMNRSVSKERIMSWIVGFVGSASSTLDVDGIIGLIFEKNSIKKKRRYNAAPKSFSGGGNLYS